ncbi:PRD domain-containing protein [Fundicoccus culcitae]|uniref:PRD domain-containing protein n=1 Tax=Fundicoccus culcitae TaxID=2969821 RepID=A0ABY5P9I1_9LACT|nr:PRD domain-containing protein [Fundicoccus culcitae]UUX35408.1 PRD domain-containing protein [Fundicoccus culcitae]
MSLKKIDELYDFIQKKTYSANKDFEGVSTNEIVEAFDMQRSNVSALLNQLVKDNKLKKTNTRPVLYQLKDTNYDEMEATLFSDLVGLNGSLRHAVQLAKAAIFYPNRRLNILLQGNKGVGTSSFAHLIYQFAKSRAVVENDAPFIKVSSRHYKSNLDALNDVLFGKNMAMEDSAFAQARGGVLFIDNFELLKPEQQNEISKILERHSQFTFAEADETNFSDVIIIIACKPNSNTSIQDKISFTIELPDLNKRPLEEKFALINKFFTIEASNSMHDIQVSSEAINGLLLADFAGNIKALEREITVASAKAYVRVIGQQDKVIKVFVNDFSVNIKQAQIKIKSFYHEVHELIGSNDYIYFDKKQGFVKNDAKDESMYQDIESKYNDLISRGINQQNIESVINTHLQQLFNIYRYEETKSDEKNLEQLSKLVDKRIIEIVDDWIEICSRELNRSFSSNVFYGLCLHINALMTASFTRQRVDNEQILSIIQNYPQEYGLSNQLSLTLKEKLNLEVPFDEVVIITMFLLKSDNTPSEEHPVLLYAMHGHSTAKSLMEVTNSLTKSNVCYSYDLDLEKDIEEAMQEFKELIIKIDQGKGVIVIYDMGSIKTMIETVSDETHIKIRGINIPVTLVGIDLARRCFMGDDIEDIYHKATKELKAYTNESEKLDKLIITLCHTGEGGAYQLKNYIDEFSNLDYNIVALAISDRQQLLKEVIELKRTNQIHAFVGTYDPKLLGIPFIPISKIFENKKENLDKILKFEPIVEQEIDFDPIYDFLDEQLKYTSMAKVKMILPELLDQLTVIFDLDKEQQIGLFMHLVSLIEKKLSLETVAENKFRDKILIAFQDDYRQLRNMFKVLEKSFNIIINDGDIATIIMILRKV